MRLFLGDFKVDKVHATEPPWKRWPSFAPWHRKAASRQQRLAKSDGAAALLIVSEKALKSGFNHVRIHHLSVRGDDPIWMLTAPIPATEYALKKPA